MKLILAHEVEHVRRGDNLVLLVQRLVETALFFHPVAWLSGRYLRREAEKACDDSVLRRYPNPVEYADSLTRIVEMRGDFQYGLPVHTFARAESQMAQRVRRILGGRTSRRVGPNLISLLLLLTAGCIGLPRHMVAAEKDQTEGDVKVFIIHDKTNLFGFHRDESTTLHSPRRLLSALVC
jgi:beta-lactamase regulating signal transducer with metallopeptidase domain